MHENKLIREKSPCLLQHSHNPVDWYPWSAEAFQKAMDEQKPIFLSIGYSTCHWCHVMERESFEDEEVAALLQSAFVAIKVDREERGDIDAVYMAVCQAMTGAGGWPLTILMTPEQKPFYAGTYLPKQERYGTIGLLELLTQVKKLWANDRERLLQAGDELVAHLNAQKSQPASQPEKALLRTAASLFARSFDRVNGGFGKAPKFPTPHNLLLLLRYAAWEQDVTAQEMAETTLTQMAQGGIFDQLGGGFSRYSTDERWLVPHFEKMLYDNALLAYTYLEAFRISDNPLYRETATRTLNYVLRELTDPAGGFYCGQDADSDGVEGKYYVFTPAEVKTVLGDEDGTLFCARFDVTEQGNFEGNSIPNLLNQPQRDLPDPRMDALCQSLYDYRMTRVSLHKDDKILTSWNALMISALAKANRTLGEPRYLTAAQGAHAFIRTHLTDENGRLFVRWRDGDAAHDGQLDDYAFYAWALLELYAADFDVSCLREVIAVTGHMVRRFFDENDGGFYLYASDAEQLIDRPKELYDGAAPSGNAAAALALVRLAKLTGEPHWQEYADKQLAFLAGNAQDYPAGHSFSLLAMGEALYPAGELVCALSDGKLPDGLRTLVEDNHLAALVKTADNAQELIAAAPFIAAYPVPAQGETYYLCRNGACAQPVYQFEALRELLAHW